MKMTPTDGRDRRSNRLVDTYCERSHVRSFGQEAGAGRDVG